MKKFQRISLCVLCLLVVVSIPFAYKKTASGQTFPIQTQKHKFVLTLWHVDTFEGGVGSRADFLSSRGVEYSSDGVIIMVKNHTVESLKTAFSKGEIPDMISYGVGVEFVLPYLKSLPKTDFLGGEINGKHYAYPWCVGGYYLITKTEDNRLIDRLFISQNDYNLPFVAKENHKIEARETVFKKPLDAYVSFLSGKDCAILGTQRDIRRLQSRGVEFFATPLENFSDLIQYVSVTSQSQERYEESLKFLQYLTAEKCQLQLEKIGMFSAFFSVGQGDYTKGYDFKKVEYTVSPFTHSYELVEIIDELRRENITNSSLLKAKNTLKRLK